MKKLKIKVKLHITKWQSWEQNSSQCDSEDMKKLQDSDECIKYLYEEEKREKTILKVTVECNLKTSRKILLKACSSI